MQLIALVALQVTYAGRGITAVSRPSPRWMYLRNCSGHKLNSRRFCNAFYCGCGSTPKQRGFRVSFLGDIQNPVGPGPKSPAANPGLSRSLDWTISRAASNLISSVILGEELQCSALCSVLTLCIIVVWAGTELIFFIVAHTVLCFEFVTETPLMTQGCFSYCWKVLTQH